MSPVAKAMTEVRSLDGERVPVAESLWMWCPGCDQPHRIQWKVYEGGSGPVWTWDGNLEAPTISPSILCHSSAHACGTGVEHYEVCADEACERTHYESPDGPAHIQPCSNWGPCHSFLVNGQWQFLSDSAHSLAGQTVPMVPLPVWLAEEERG